MYKNYLWQIFIAIDQLLNTFCGGWADETLSSRAYRLARNENKTTPMNIIDFICSLFGDTEHCKKSYENEIKRMQCPPEMRD